MAAPGVSLGMGDPVVITEELLQRAIREAEEEECAESGDLLPEMATPFPVTKKLVLSFRQVYQLGNLATFDSLQELRLDNNRIKQIDGLSRLTALTWLDLSFNEIEAIEGLDTLVNLTDLSLFQNRISAVQGLSSLTNLHCLSLGNNKVESLDQLLVLRPLTSLTVLSLTGNPVCSDADYRASCLAYLKHLQYLDYAVTGAAELVAAREASAQVEELMEAEEKEGIEEASRAREGERVAAVRQLEEANIDVVETLFDDIFKDDTEIAKVKLLPGVQVILDEYRERFSGIADTLKTKGLASNKAIVAEIDLFQAAVLATNTADCGRARDMVSCYQRHQKRALRAFYADHEGDGMQGLVVLREEARRLADALLEGEMLVSEQMETTIDLFDSALNDLRLSKLAHHQVFFRAMENVESKYFEAVSGLGETLLKQAAEEGTAEDLGDSELASLLQERDSLLGAISGSHDAHVSVIIAREDSMSARENQRCKSIVADARLEEKARNRDRIHEIQAMLKRHEGVIDDAMYEAQDDEHGE